jgi:hypothetical protein
LERARAPQQVHEARRQAIQGEDAGGPMADVPFVTGVKWSETRETFALTFRITGH